ncbi:SufE family protein [Candidatus Karelsulcia muelleri]|uniref:Sulfur acceptor for SufS cysteine desulfurase n=1 Tax=Candidatus Karelsulcia muelleri TaxID=336810 RepID=A0A346E0R0_9FLAO|nr:SufE family protein [Candidatus Karelsulcia muelleri]AXN02565.1 sulfur acceptor for SufS cysteine desulfurase [Candidatus Karelsulcia muelleri]WDI79507.1 SufE family protein [Candidatus Karelsulcia muelleri]WDR78965.1 SufE family protein [Candidatus Karelsulcia muelleri]
MKTLLKKEQRTLILLYYLKKKKILYNYLITLGNKINFYKPKFINKKNILNGCKSQLWLGFLYKKRKIYVFSYSNSILIMGFSFLITKIYSNNFPIDIINHKTSLSYNSLLSELFSYNRTNTIKFILNKIKQEALKYLI